MAGVGRFGARTDRVSLGEMLLDLSGRGDELPVRISLPGRAPVRGSVPGGTLGKACNGGRAKTRDIPIKSLPLSHFLSEQTGSCLGYSSGSVVNKSG